MEARRFVISGKVQGVFFRASTAHVASGLGLRGHVRNLEDGRVEVLALGTPESVGELAVWLRAGPPSARVADVREMHESVAEHADLGNFRTL